MSSESPCGEASAQDCRYAGKPEKSDVPSAGSAASLGMYAAAAAGTVRVAALALVLSTVGCGDTTSIFNPALIATIFGGEIPLTPGPVAAFVLVRTVNATDQVVEFIVTIQRKKLVVDDGGNFVVDEAGDFLTTPERETVRLATFPGGRASEIGVLFPCGESPLTHVGLGENLLPTDAAVFVGGQGVAGAAGFGVSPGDLNPLQLDAGNFNCGDTIIFRAFRAIGVAGNVGLESFLLPGSEQPSIFRGPSTFVNLEQFLESQVREDEP